MKFAVEIVVTKMAETYYIVEADDLDEARRNVEDMLDDPVFTNEVDDRASVCPIDDEYVVSDVFEVGNYEEVGSFFTH